ncbi:TPA: recombination protein NinB [Enterobacter ludwigii]|nr:recombination protein NinB [Enterobacter ludwigii]
MNLQKDGIRLHKSNFNAIGQQIQPMLESGDCYRLIIKPWKEKRSLSQNSLMWMWNGDVATAVNLHSSSKLTEEDLHEFLKDMFCPAKPVTVLGVTKMVKSTKLLDTEEMTFYLRRIEVWCAERGIKLRIPANSEYHEKGHDHV